MDFPERQRTADRHRGGWAVLLVAAAAALTMATGLTMATTAAAAPNGANAWGKGEVGQLGNGVAGQNNPLPGPVSGLTEVTALSGGREFALALLSTGTVKAWGVNGSGQLGNGSTSQSTVPVAVKELTEVASISAGADFSLALLKSGKVMAWGNNEYGELGNGTTTNSNVPVEVKGLPEGFKVTAVAAGGTQSLALVENEKKETKVMAWGFNEYGQLGDGTNTGPEKCVIEAAGEKFEYPCSKTPVEVKGLSGVTAISAGFWYSLALLSGGTVKAWGSEEFGELGNEKKSECTTFPCEKKAFSDEPVEVKGLKEVQEISAGGIFALALLKSGAIKAWGAGEMGELGNGSTTTSDVPVAVSELTSGVTAVAAGYDHALALLSSATVDAWGDNHAGELGNGTTAQSDVPVAVGQGLGEVAGISAGTEFSLSYGAPAPTVTGLSPKTGPAAGGSEVKISGTNFTGATAVKFGTTSATEKEVNAEGTSITTHSPAGTGTVDVTVTTPALISRTNEKDRFTYRTAGLKTEWLVNGVTLNTKPSSIVSWGTLTFENSFDKSVFGKLTCHIFGGGNIWNEGEAGFGSIEAFGTSRFTCSKEPSPCPGAFLTDEGLLHLAEIQEGTEKVTVARRGASVPPWSGEVNEVETEKAKFLKDEITGIKLALVLPCEQPPVAPGEYAVEGSLEPNVVNGNKNGLFPSHLQFQGKGGKTGHLKTDFVTFRETEKETFVSGEMTMVGTKEELVQAE